MGAIGIGSFVRLVGRPTVGIVLGLDNRGNAGVAWLDKPGNHWMLPLVMLCDAVSDGFVEPVIKQR